MDASGDGMMSGSGGEGMKSAGSGEGEMESHLPASIGGSIATFLLVSIGCVVAVAVVAVLVRRKRKRTGMFEITEMNNEKHVLGGVTNAMYDYDNVVGKTGTDKGPDYALPSVINQSQADMSGTEKTGTYDYAVHKQISIGKGGISRGAEAKDSKPKVTVQQSSSSRRGKDQTYMAPANEEVALYAQIIDIRIKEIRRTTVELGCVLGTGNFGTVLQGSMKNPSGEEVKVAVKTLKEGSAVEDRVKFLQEAAIMGQFRHPNVVKLHGVVIEDEPVLIVLELLSKGDLRYYLGCQRFETVSSVDSHTLLSYCRQVAAGMAYLSNKGFVHRDLAARNVLLSENGICKIADFGLSRDLMDEDYYISHGGKIPVKWTAPEAINYRKYSSASDVWSFGVLMFEIWSIGRKPYEGKSLQEIIGEIEEGYRLPPPPGTPRAIYELMIDTWDIVSSERPKFEDIMERLSLPDTTILQSTSADGAVDSTKLGAELSHGDSLYSDLQTKYYF